MNEPPAHGTLLLVEDNEDDVFLLRRALRDAELRFPLQIVENGQQAIAYLAAQGEYADRNRFPFPTVVFLDLKLPYMHGFDVLKWIRAQRALHGLAVVVLTSSPEDRDRRRAAELGANDYRVKPPTSRMLIEVVQPLATVDRRLAGNPLL